MDKTYRIAIAGTGYVGLSIATLLAQHHEVTAVDVIPEKVEKLNKRISPIQDEYIEKYLAEKPLNLRATLDGREAYREADFVVIAAPTNYDPVKNYFHSSLFTPKRHSRPLHGHEGGRGCEALRQHLPRPARQLLQRA